MTTVRKHSEKSPKTKVVKTVARVATAAIIAAAIGTIIYWKQAQNGDPGSKPRLEDVAAWLKNLKPAYDLSDRNLNSDEEFQDEMGVLTLEHAYHEIVPNLFLGGEYDPKKIYMIDDKELKEFGGSRSRASTEQGLFSHPPFGLVVQVGETESKNRNMGDPELFAFPSVDADDPEQPGLQTVSVRSFDDEPGAEDLGVLKRALCKINKALEKQEKVLVHCRQGVDRSPTVVAAYLMAKYGLTYNEAYNAVLSRRIIAQPNEVYPTIMRKNEDKIKGEIDTFEC